ncbi:LOG family protein [Holzapfeliella sp. JNUCC 80]
MRNKRLAVYCGAKIGNNIKYKEAVMSLGQKIINHNFDLVYGGGTVGLMGVIAETVLQQNGEVYAIMPKFLKDLEGFEDEAQHTEIVDSMSVRKQRMLELSDFCIAMPGGAGTLEEIVEAYSWHILGQVNNPCAFYNIDGFYTPMEAMYDNMVVQGYLSKENRQKLFFSDSLDDIFAFFENYQG